MPPLTLKNSSVTIFSAEKYLLERNTNMQEVFFFCLLFGKNKCIAIGEQSGE